MKIIILEDCRTKDSDSCLQESPEWSNSARCTTSTNYCDSWEKDMKRCCPVTCNNGDALTKEECDALSQSGTCTYPNDAQCPSKPSIRNFGQSDLSSQKNTKFYNIFNF